MIKTNTHGTAAWSGPSRSAGSRGQPGVIRGLVAAAVAVAVPATGIAGQEPAGRRAITVTETRISELRGTDELVDALLRNDELRLASRTPDRYLPARVREGLMQYHEGVRVLGGGLSRQLAGGVTVSIFGTLHEGIDVDTTPLVSADDALGLIGRQTGSRPATNALPSLVILPTLPGDYVLAWRMPMTDRQTYFLDAHDGRIVHQESNVFEQDASVGVGVGIQGQRKKLSTSGAYFGGSGTPISEEVEHRFREVEHGFRDVEHPFRGKWNSGSGVVNARR